MKLIFTALLLAVAAFAQGTVQQSISKLGETNVWVLTFRWTGDASTGAVPNTVGAGLTCCQGYYVTQAETIPGSPSPTSGYALQLKDEAGGDMLGGAANSLSSTAAQTWAAAPSSPPLQGAIHLVITGQSAAGAKGVVHVFLVKPGTINVATLGQPPNWINLANSPFVDLRRFGATCDGTTNVASSVAAAIAAGWKNLYLPAGCLYIPVSNTTPANVSFQCELPSTSIISSDNPASAQLYLASGSQLNNCGIKSGFCTVSAAPYNVAKTCTIAYAKNAADVTVDVSWWSSQGTWINAGPTLQMEAAISICGAANNGSGLIRLTSCASNSYQTNDTVVIQGVGGVSAANRVSALGNLLSWKITRIDSTRFDLQGSTFGGSYTSGGTAYRAAKDIPQIGIIQRSIGDGFYAATTGDGIGYRAEVKTGDNDGSGYGGTGILAYVFADAKGFGGTFKSLGPDGAALLIERQAGTAIAVGDGGVYLGTLSTGNFLDISSYRTSGTFINFYQSSASASNFTGLLINAGNGGGSYTGLMIDLQNNSTPIFTVNATGNLTMPVYKSTTGTRYLCVNTLGNVVSSASACSGT